MIDLRILSTPYCPPCDFARQIAEKLRNEFPDLRVTRMDLTKHPELGLEHQVFAVPGILINGKLEFHGGVNETQLRDKLCQIG